MVGAYILHIYLHWLVPELPSHTPSLPASDGTCSRHSLDALEKMEQAPEADAGPLALLSDSLVTNTFDDSPLTYPVPVFMW